MSVVVLSQEAVPFPTVGDDPASRDDIAGTIRDHFQADAAESLPLFFNSRKNDGFTVGPTTAPARLLAANKKLVNLDIS